MMYFTSPSSSSFARVGPSRGVEASTQTSFFAAGVVFIDEPPPVPESTTAVERPPTGTRLNRENGLTLCSETSAVQE